MILNLLVFNLELMMLREHTIKDTSFPTTLHFCFYLFVRVCVANGQTEDLGPGNCASPLKPHPLALLNYRKELAIFILPYFSREQKI